MNHTGTDDGAFALHHLGKKSYTVKAGKTLDLSEKLIFTPKGSTASLKWKSSDESIATVSSSGKVTALTPGTVTITVKGSGGLKATVKIKVK